MKRAPVAVNAMLAAIVAVAGGTRPTHAFAQEISVRAALNPDSAGSTYRAIVDAQRARLATSAGDGSARRALIRALTELGRYDEAEREASSAGAQFARLLGDVKLARGKLHEAAASYQQSLEAHSPDSVTARVRLALMRLHRGERDAAVRDLEWFIQFYNNAPKPNAEELTAVGEAVAALGFTDPQLSKDAVKAFEDAAVADPKTVDARIAEARLFLDKFDSNNGTPIILEALAIEPANPRALVQLARAKRFDGSAEAIRHVDEALLVNPNLAEAHQLRAELLFASEDYAGAAKEAGLALSVDPSNAGALGVQGAVAYLNGDNAGYETAKRAAQALNPRGTTFLTMVSSLIANERRFIESVTLAREAVGVDSTAWDAHTLAGMGAFRLGRFEEAATSLAVAFKGDPYNPWVKNTLDLIDKYPQYDTRRSNRFELLLNKSESDLVELYMMPLAEAAYDTFSARYRWKPEGRIRIEVYPRHGDFSVRTVGIAGLGALGVSFGEILAMDSPAARKVSEFHWASTMWHEVAHTFTLGLSRMKVPRWLTEGISGWEEAHAHPGWGDPLTPSFISAYAGGKLPPLSGLTPAFVRPAYPEQVMHAYQMAELVIEHITSTRGVDAVRRMVAAFGDGRSQDEVFRDVLKVTPAQYDAEFDAYMRKRFAGQISAIEGGQQSLYATALSRGKSLLEEGNVEEAARELDRARTLFPDYAGPGSPYQALAQLEQKRGNDAAAMAWLDQLTQRFAQDYESWVALAALREKKGDRKGAAAALQQAILVSPYDPAIHDKLAMISTAAGRHLDAVRERRAIVALKPVDRAAAHYNLALALEAAGDKAAGKSEVLKALEIAPGYAAAQELLLRLQAVK